MVTAFEKETGIKVAMTRKSSGETYAQVKAEAANPRADIWWGGTGDPHLQAAEEDLTQEYKSPKLPELNDWAMRQ
jgi:iron(III) transport system substrate-binding protein